MKQRARLRLAGAAAVFLVAAGVYQGPVYQERLDLEMIQKIRTEGLENSHIPQDAHYLMDVIGPRLTGSPGMERANEWMARKYREYGLVNVHQEEWDGFGRGWEEVSYFGRMVEPFAKPLIGRALAWTGSTNGRVRGPAVLVDIESEEDFAQYRGKLKNAWILTSTVGMEPRDPRPADLRIDPVSLLQPPEQRAERGQQQRPQISEEELQRMRAERAREREARRQFQEKIDAFMAAEGVAGELSRSRWLDAILVGGGGGSRTVGAPEGNPVILLTDEDYSMIARNVENGTPVTVEFEVQNRFLDSEQRPKNTVGEIRGTDRADEVVMIGAHLDSWHMGTGGTDNGAGSIVMLEAMRIIKAVGATPRRTIRIALWSGEEQGLIGSRKYVEAHADELDRVSVYLNMDNGSGRFRGVYTQENPYADGIFSQVLWPFRDIGFVANRLGNTRGTDHLSFDRAGVPGFQFVQDPIEYNTKTHHTNVDTYDALMLEDLKQAATIVAAAALHFANRDEMFPRKPAAEEGGRY